MRFETAEGALDVEIDRVIVAGWTARDRVAVQHHIDELAAIGVTPPSEVPLFYRVSAGLLAQGDIQVLGDHTSGEVEPFLLQADGVLWLGLASDHTDRELEVHSVAASKQACAKPVASALWRFDEVAGHADQLTLACDIEEQGWVRYQDGTLAGIQPLTDLVGQVALEDGTSMLCGTLGAIGGVRPAARYRMALSDPVLGRAMSFEYAVTKLPIVS